MNRASPTYHMRLDGLVGCVEALPRRTGGSRDVRALPVLLRRASTHPTRTHRQRHQPWALPVRLRCARRTLPFSGLGPDEPVDALAGVGVGEEIHLAALVLA